jgi:nucleotide sugar dehydrogenase
MKLNIGIVGNGFVGQATSLFETKDTNVIIYDIDPSKCKPEGITLENFILCDLIFICVPTPMEPSGKCHTSIVENIVKKLKTIVDVKKTQIVIRSTVPAGTAHSLDCFFMPEFLTEKNWKTDFQNCNTWIFGLTKNQENNDIFISNIQKLIKNAFDYNKIQYNSVVFINSDEAEMIKYFRNTFLAVKVSYCNEIEEFCRKKGIDYEKVKNIASLDHRITRNHTNVPGHDGKRGYGGTCFPKDIQSLHYQMQEVNMKSFMIKSSIERNETIDRVEKDWETNKGRSVIE